MIRIHNFRPILPGKCRIDSNPDIPKRSDIYTGVQMKRLIGIFLMATLLLSCGKKKEEIEKSVGMNEEATTSAVLPPAGWNKSLAVEIPEGLSSVERALFQEFSNHLSADLAKLRSLRVSIWPSGAGGKGLRADAVLESNIEYAGSVVRWTFSLKKIDANTELWTQSAETRAEQVYKLSKEAALQTASTLGIDANKITNLVVPSPGSEIFKQYLEGRACFLEGSKEKMDCAVQRFKEALRTDSTFIPAWLGLGESYLSLIRNRWNANRVWIQLAQDAAFRAVRLDSTRADARFLLAQVYNQWGDIRAAEKETRKALEIDPNLAEAWRLLADFAVRIRNQYDTGLDAYGRALDLLPASTDAALGKSMLLMGLGRYSEAKRTLDQVLQFNPDAVYLHSFIGLADFYLGDRSTAYVEIQKGLESETYRPFSHAVSAMIEAASGRGDAALSEVTLQVEPFTSNNASLCVTVAAVYALLGRNGLSIQWLEKAVSFGYKDTIWLSNDSNFAELRKDPRFIDLVDRLKKETGNNPTE